MGVCSTAVTELNPGIFQIRGLRREQPQLCHQGRLHERDDRFGFGSKFPSA